RVSLWFSMPDNPPDRHIQYGQRHEDAAVDGPRDQMTEKIPINQRMNGSEWLSLGLLSVLWCGSFFFAGVLIRTLPPLTIVLLRVGLAAVILNALVRALGMRMPAGGRARGAVFALGLRPHP